MSKKMGTVRSRVKAHKVIQQLAEAIRELDSMVGCKKKAGGPVDHWIQGAVNPEKKGSLHKMVKIPQGKKIPMKVLEEAKHSRSPLERERANFAINVRKSTHRSQGR